VLQVFFVRSFSDDLESLLKKNLITSKVDTTGVSIGRRYLFDDDTKSNSLCDCCVLFLTVRYARTDELGIPFGLTVDFLTLSDQTVTLRERDSTEQVRIPISECAKVLHQIIGDESTWEDVKRRFPLQQAVANDVTE
jgi:glycyl-tRNA synthetase (class II)